MYTINQASKITNLSIYTIRYYDKVGLLPLVKRSKTGVRIFNDTDIQWIQLICCLKSSGMSIENIKEFMNLCLSGSISCEARKQLLVEQKQLLQEKISNLQCSLEIIDYKIEHYKEIGIFHIDRE